MVKKYFALFLLLAGLAKAQMTAVQIGNTGLPTSTTGHVPYLIPGIATDSAGKVYTVHDWDEPHQDCKVWDPSTGQPISNTGNLGTGQQLDACCVEPDGSYVYATGWSGKAPNITLWIWKIDPVHNTAIKFTGTGSYVIQVSTTSSATLLPIALGGNTLWVADNTGNRVVGYDKVTGSQTLSFSFGDPRSIAVDTARNNIWVGWKTALYVYSGTTGAYLATGAQNLTNATSIYIQGRNLVIADRALSTVYLCTISSTGLSAAFTHTYSTGFSTYIWDAAIDSNGNLLVTDSIGANGGSRMRKFDPSHNLLWTQTCTEFNSNVAYSPANPNTFISLKQQMYAVNRTAGTTTWTGYGGGWQNPTGPITVLNLGGNDFEFVCGPNNSTLLIYRVSGSALTLIQTLSPPQPDGPGTWTVDSYSVDSSGTVWLANAYHHITTFPYSERPCVWKVPLSSLDGNGNPVYNWNQAAEVVTEPAIRAALGVSTSVEVDNEMTAFDTSANLVYVLIYSPTTGVNRGGFWMAGNTLLAFNLSGTLAWMVNLPAASVGMCPVPGGGVLVGDNTGVNGGGVVHRYSATGALVTSYSPPASLGGPNDNPCGAFDEFGALNCQLAPDGLLDIFCEDDFNCRVIWYHTQ